MWADVRRFLENPGEVLERVGEQLVSDDDVAELEERRKDLSRRLAERRSEKDRYVKLYARGHLSEEAYQARRQLVGGITAGRREDGRADIKITYRFGPPPADNRGELVGAGVGFVPAGKNGKP